jgi:hypothetical protein
MSISGSVTLSEAVKWGDDALKKGVVDIFIRESPILERLPFITIEGNALRHMVEDELGTVAFRDVGDTYTRDFGTDTEHFWGVAILGGEVFVDNYIVRTRGNLGDVKARQYAKKAKANAMTFDKYFFDGTGTSKDFKGVNTLITEGFGQVYTPNASGGALTLDYLDYAHDLLRTGTADAMLLNRTLRRKITSLARTTHTGISLIDVGNDAFGRQVMSWNGVPLGIVGDDATGTAILGFDETAGGSNVTASIYFVRYGADEYVCGLLGAGGSLEVRDFGETEAAPGHLGRIEWYPGIAVFNQYAIVRLAGITNA